MRVRKNSTLPLLASTALFSTGILASAGASASSMTTETTFPQSTIPTSSSSITAASPRTTPTAAPIGERAVVDAPPSIQPATPTQVSPVMVVHVNGKPVLYTQKFSAVPDQWPKPSSGSIGLGTATKTAGKRSEATDASSLKLRCRTVECRDKVEKADRKERERVSREGSLGRCLSLSI